jgi:hypothetical protein
MPLPFTTVNAAQADRRDAFRRYGDKALRRRKVTAENKRL